LSEIGFEPIQHGVGFGATQFTARVGRQLARSIFDVVHLSDLTSMDSSNAYMA
jgi:hypothetical protein